MEDKMKDLLRWQRDINDLKILSDAMDKATWLVNYDPLINSDYADEDEIQRGINSFYKAKSFVNYLISCAAKEYVDIVDWKANMEV